MGGGKRDGISDHLRKSRSGQRSDQIGAKVCGLRFQATQTGASRLGGLLGVSEENQVGECPSPDLVVRSGFPACERLFQALQGEAIGPKIAEATVFTLAQNPVRQEKPALEISPSILVPSIRHLLL